MQNTYKIYPILTCKFKLCIAEFTYRRNYDKWVLVPIYAFLIKGGKEPFLVDTGISLEGMSTYANPSVFHGGEEGPPIEDSLKKIGISASDITTVILTHIHLDHFINAKKFPRAKLIVQEKELAFARNPHPLFAKTYQPDLLEGLTFETINGDTEIMPGVEAILTPGHSPGGQSVSVPTEQGKMVIVGYCSVDENFGEQGDIVVGMHTDLLQAYDSMIKIREISDTIIPLHSQKMLNVKSIP